MLPLISWSTGDQSLFDQCRHEFSGEADDACKVGGGGLVGIGTLCARGRYVKADFRGRVRPHLNRPRQPPRVALQTPVRHVHDEVPV